MPMNVQPVPTLNEPHQRHPAAHRGDHQRRYPAERTKLWRVRSRRRGRPNEEKREAVELREHDQGAR